MKDDADFRFSEIGQRLKAVRTHFQMGSKEFAEQADVSAKSYSQWETGSGRISVDGAMKLQARYGISLDFIYLGRVDTLPNSIAAALSSKPSTK
ncbi:helix-turn-helix domain-containing protein [Salipiger thiooxidans]|uniref:helix-turn-helix domain-containing protein n=1 Tax=Salipiger thiooxidans TaxID=282683 RepID=UPI001CFBF0BC|nr:helix-turn-helix transcriptional regulator [Salipiger thiooxidans]